MFTGIVEAVGEIKQVRSLEGGISLSIAPGMLNLEEVETGDSIAVNGVCLTVTGMANDMFSVDVSRETLDCTEGLDKPGGQVNLERALLLSDRLDGHLVSGHVDASGEVSKLEPAGESYTLVIKAPDALLKYIARKGSISVNGVSLTVNRIAGNELGDQSHPSHPGRYDIEESENGRESKPGSGYVGAICRAIDGNCMRMTEI